MKPLFFILCKIFFLPVARILTKKTEGKENIPPNGSFIVAPNHNDGFDHWFVFSLFRKRIRKVRFLAALDTIRTFLLSSLLYYLAEPIIINRNNVDRKEALQKMINSLKRGEIIVIYPEGDSNPKENLLKGKTGVAELALKSGAPVIPVGILTQPDSLRRTLRVGKPIQISASREISSPEEYRQFLRNVTDTIMENISRLSHKPYPYGNQ